MRTYRARSRSTGPGEHVVEYFATDAAENVEAIKRLAFRVDGTAPTTHDHERRTRTPVRAAVTLNTAPTTVRAPAPC